eukprot:gene7600-biopygen16566
MASGTAWRPATSARWIVCAVWAARCVGRPQGGAVNRAGTSAGSAGAFFEKCGASAGHFPQSTTSFSISAGQVLGNSAGKCGAFCQKYGARQVRVMCGGIAGNHVHSTSQATTGCPKPLRRAQDPREVLQVGSPFGLPVEGVFTRNSGVPLNYRSTAHSWHVAIRTPGW